MLQPRLQPHHTNVLHLWQPDTDQNRRRSMRNMPWQRQNIVEYALQLQNYDRNMIHYNKEGDYLKIGLNYKFGHVGYFPWIAFVWCWYNVQKRTLTTKRLRVRTHMSPYIVKESSESDTISNYLMSHDLIACPRELLEDYAPKLIPLAGYFNEQYKAGVIGRYNG